MSSRILTSDHYLLMNAINNKIKELAYDAEEYADTVVDCGGEFHESYSEKLIQLVVQECIAILNQNNPDPPETVIYSTLYDEYFDIGWQVAVETKIHQIKQHFGIEQ